MVFIHPPLASDWFRSGRVSQSWPMTCKREGQRKFFKLSNRDVLVLLKSHQSFWEPRWCGTEEEEQTPGEVRS